MYDQEIDSSTFGRVSGGCMRTKFAERGLAYADPVVWNCLPESIRRTSSQAAFKRQLKTLFCILWCFWHCFWSAM